jgi:hypothetical protein
MSDALEIIAENTLRLTPVRQRSANGGCKKKFYCASAHSKNGNVIVDAVFLALSDTLGDPNDVAHLL